MLAFWQELDALSQSVKDFAAGFDAHCLTPSAAESVVRSCATMEASISSVKRLAAARAAEGTGWQHEGYRSPAEQLAHQTGMSPTAARRAIDTGRRMADQPDIAHAALAGELSPEQAAAVADGAAADPARARDLLDKARRMTLPELNQEVARTKAATNDADQRRQKIRAQRCLKRWSDPEGAHHAHLYGLPEDATTLWRALDPIRRRLNMTHRHHGQPVESLPTLDYDALMTLAAAAVGTDAELAIGDLVALGLFPGLQSGSIPATSTPATPPPDAPPPDAPPPAIPRMTDLFTALGTDRSPSGHSNEPKRPKKLAGSPAKVIIRVDLDTLLRGCQAGDEICEIAGWGPLDARYVRALIHTGQAQLAAILTRQKKISGVYLDRRHPNAWQKTALDFTHTTCAVAGCNARSELEYDHRVPHASTGYTLLELLDRLCPHHHKLKTHHGWALIEGIDKRPFVPPDDPRHPDNTARTTREGPAP